MSACNFYMVFRIPYDNSVECTTAIHLDMYFLQFAREEFAAK